MNMNKYLIRGLLCASALASAIPAWAGAIQIGLVPTSSLVQVGQQVFIDITVSGLQSGGRPNVLSAWSLGLHFDREQFAPVLAAPSGFGDWLGSVQAGEAVGFVDNGVPGLLGLSLVSLLTDAELQGLQRDTSGSALDAFTLAHIGFRKLRNADIPEGTFYFSTDALMLAGEGGDPIMDSNGAVIPSQNGSVAVGVPEPATLPLVAAGFMLAMAARRRAPRLNPPSARSPAWP